MMMMVMITLWEVLWEADSRSGIQGIPTDINQIVSILESHESSPKFPSLPFKFILILPKAPPLLQVFSTKHLFLRVICLSHFIRCEKLLKEWIKLMAMIVIEF